MADDLKNTTVYHTLLFNSRNHLLLTKERNASAQWETPFSGNLSGDQDPETLSQKQLSLFTGREVSAKIIFEINLSHTTHSPHHVLFALDEELDQPSPNISRATFFTLENLYSLLEKSPELLAQALKEIIPHFHQYAIRIPYLNQKETNYIYRFRTEKHRNEGIYHQDSNAKALYQSFICQAIKLVKRQKERSPDIPATLNFGAVSYILPSHFGFCLGVRNAIERAYETLSLNPNKRVFMLSELIHNPFVNEDLLARGLHYLQSDRGVPLLDSDTGKPLWDTLTKEDIVIIPAFGATDEDKIRLIEKGLPLNKYDATCMLVEKVWKAARRYGQEGYTVIIHGKTEHEETKATFSNSAAYAPSLIIRDKKEAEILGRIIHSETPDEKQQLFEKLGTVCTPDFNPSKDLEKLAIVNQTTLLRNETIDIIDYLESVFAQKYGADQVDEHINHQSRGDTLCYATQVNQDALKMALDEDIDAAIVVGGKNSSNTFQLFRLCQQKFGERSFYIQSEQNILSKDKIQHYVFPYNRVDPREGRTEIRPFLPQSSDLRILITGGASCPDGIIQQIITRLNTLYPANKLRPIEHINSEIYASSPDNA